MAILPVGISAEEGSFKIERSLRFNSADSAYLNRTPASAGNGQTFTISFWLKRSAVNSSSAHSIFEAYSSGGNKFRLWFTATGNSTGADNFSLENNVGSTGYSSTWSPKYRDPSAWYHFMYVANTTSATESERQKVYVNGVQVTAYADQVAIPQNQTHLVNSNVVHYIGRDNGGNYFNGLITEFHLIDGSALTPSSFGETDTDTGVWKPKAYSGSYGTNGFYLDFGDNSSTTALGYDAAGSNDWTPNNFSVTAGAGNDSLVDSPTRYGTDTGVGGEVRGNYATLNPLYRDSITAATLTNGNLSASIPNTGSSKATVSVSSGKYYWEVVWTGSQAMYCGVSDASGIGRSDKTIQYIYTGDKIISGTSTAYGSTYTVGDVIGHALDIDSGTITFYKNNTSQGSINLSTASIVNAVPILSGGGGVTVTADVNFGQRPFAYTAPSGFKALCTTNLPEPTIADGKDYFNAVLYTGNGSTQSITGVGFQPDLVWAKCRSNSYHHKLVDAVRGTTLTLSSSQTAAEQTESNSLTAFNSDGFSLGNISSMNASAETFVAWNWKANGAGVSNTAGTISSTVSANTTAGFSVVTYTSPNSSSDQTVGHGLGVKPNLIIVKNRDAAFNWDIYHSSLGYNASLIFTTAATRSGAFGAEPTSTVFTTKNTYTHNGTDKYVAYCFAPIAGYSAFGSFVGSGSTDGPFVWTGFAPRFILVKNASYAGTSWEMFDTARQDYNQNNLELLANSSAAEGAYTFGDILSNGFKLRSSNNGVNRSGDTLIYAAFASNPFKIALGR